MIPKDHSLDAKEWPLGLSKKAPGLRPGPDGKDFGYTHLTTGGFLKATRFPFCAAAAEDVVALSLSLLSAPPGRVPFVGAALRGRPPERSHLPSCVDRGGVISAAFLLCSTNGRTGAAQEGDGDVTPQEPTSEHMVLTLGLSWGVWGGHSLARQRMVPHDTQV